MPTLKAIIHKILKNPSFEQMYNERVARYKNLSDFLPDEYTEIVNFNGPWFVHGLAFRMATYSLENDRIFSRLNDLIEKAKQLNGWENELANTGPSWSCNYDEFFHFLWMLKCMEYFLDDDFDVQFSNKTKRRQPDLTIKSRSGNQFFAECYVYSKWWFKEIFLEDIVRLIHPNLRIERMYNLRTTNIVNLIDDLLNDIGNITSPNRLEIAEKEASVKSPYILKESGGIRIIFEGEGEYQPSINAHGDPSESANVYLKEIVKHKENQNDLKSHRPNVLLVNGLGTNFQKLFFNEGAESLFLESTNIDKVALFACGIDTKLHECNRKLSVIKKILQT